ncbi:MAG: Eco57I restriction-modification methylase domain-containing protein [Chloroflexota bacterium]
MDNRPQLEKLTRSFSREILVSFMRAASGCFSAKQADYSRFVESDMPVRELHKQGQIDFQGGNRLIVLTGKLDKELTTHTGKRQQYDLGKKVLKDEHYDAGVFVFHDEAGHFRFSLIVTHYYGSKREFSSYRRYTYFVTPEPDQNRTFIEQIGKADFSSIEKIIEAFSVEPVTKDFFRDYKRIFDEAEVSINLNWSTEQKRLYTQRFFNRMMFIAFLERKNWLTFGGRKDYLKALFEDYHKNETDKSTANFHRSRLNTLFFWGLNNPRGDERNNLKFQELTRRIGDVPFLNGGLFDQEADDETWFFPDSITAKILSELLYRYNFTVTESTPLDVEVAVDPEMLGKIFEELVTGRHESGSYYTPKPVVAFMCREALKGYLKTLLPAEKEEALALFVDKNDPADLRNPELTLEVLKAVKVCDPACGSGAYLLGMMHELLEQRECLFAAHVADATKIYDRKLEIIQNNLYGVDLDPFAVSIARLRLWLSLIVDFEGDDPPPLPNLDFKIEAGDSLTAPDPSGGLQPDMFRQQQVKEFLGMKNEFMNSRAGSEEKHKLAEQIKELRARIGEWAHPKGYDKSSNAFDWQVDFAEVFAPSLSPAPLPAGEGVRRTGEGKEGGFDIVLANPPYVRQELLGDFKEVLKPIYPEVYSGIADLYVYFYARAHQLLRNGGVSCFISSNKWLRAGYGEKLRQHLLDSQAFSLVVDFGELPVFQTAATFPAIFLWHKKPRSESPTKWAVVKNLQECYDEGIFEHIARIGQIIPAEQFGKNKSRLASKHSSNRREIMEKSGPRLGDFVNGQIYYGVKTGLNEAFVLDRNTRDELLAKDKKNENIIRPFIVGDDVRKFEIKFRERYLIWTYIGVPITEYPHVYSHLQKFEKKAKARTDMGRYWWELRSCDYYDLFNKTKISIPAFAAEPRFAKDNGDFFSLSPAYFIPTNDDYLLGVLNSGTAFSLLLEICSVLGDEGNRGRAVLRPIYFQNLPIPDASQSERKAVAKLAEQAQKLHTQRRVRVEKFLREIGVEPAESTSRNPLEKPWSLTAEEFTRKSGKSELIPTYNAAQEETMSVTEEIVKVESEIDARVKSLYGVD